MTNEHIGEIQQITYFRQVKAPTLKQYLHRRAVKETMEQVKGVNGKGIDPDTNKVTPLSAIKAKEILKGQTADDLMLLHPDWVEDYNREYRKTEG